MHDYSGSVLVITRKLAIKHSLVGCLVYRTVYKGGYVWMRTWNTKEKLKQSSEKCGLLCTPLTSSHMDYCAHCTSEGNIQPSLLDTRRPYMKNLSTKFKPH